jgi:DNA-binding NarL/FixJ family response regulator
MHVVLVGTPQDRSRLRAVLPDAVTVAGEASTVAEARRAGHLADAWLLAPSRSRDGGSEVPAKEEALTEREHQVLELLADGFPNKRIAARLSISDQTVKFHVASICGKLGAANRTEAVRLALRRGLLTV